MDGIEPETRRLLIDHTRCFACAKPGAHACAECGNAHYCSEKCQKTDWKLHKYLCDASSLTEPRPSPTHRRCILFPARSEKADLVWLDFKDEQLGVSCVKCAEPYWKLGDCITPRLVNGPGHRIIILHPFLSMDDCLPNNRVLAKLLRMKIRSAPRWETAFLAYGTHDGAFVDLDTSALVPILNGFRKEAKAEAISLRRKVKALETLTSGGIEQDV